MSNMYDYLDAGFKVFGIYGRSKDGSCECENPDCEAVLKHPRINKWQSVPHWSDEQLETFEQMGHFKTGFGVLCTGYLIIDVDARNGGVESFKMLCEDIPEAANAAFVVNTGSGHGSQHHYFKLSSVSALSQSHKRYIGIDFKTSGYVIGASSLHASGNYYETERGNPCDITEAPAALVQALSKPARHRVMMDGQALDVDAAQVAEMLSFVSPDCSYEQWIKAGMAVHHCLDGSDEAFYIWDEWSSKGAGYPNGDQLQKHLSLIHI